MNHAVDQVPAIHHTTGISYMYFVLENRLLTRLWINEESGIELMHIEAQGFFSVELIPLFWLLDRRALISPPECSIKCQGKERVEFLTFLTNAPRAQEPTGQRELFE